MSKGCRALTDEELEQLKEYFDRIEGNETYDKYDQVKRNRTLVFFTFYTGFRIQEVLSVKIFDVLQYGKISDSVYLQKENTKGKREGRVGVINDKCKIILQEYIDHYKLGDKEDGLLFFSRKGGGLQTRQARKIFDDAFSTCEFTGKVSCHTARKTFAKKVYKAVGNSLPDLQRAMGHSDISSTSKYITFDNEKVQTALTNLEF